MKSRLRHPLKRLGTLGLAALFGTAAHAEWSDDPAANFVVADDAGGATQPHIVAAPDGGFYVSWNSSQAGGFDIRLQRLDANGNELWAHDGILVADRSYGFTYDYGLAVDSAGNAYLSYNCCINNSLTEHIVVSKVTPGGTLAWGANGVTLETGSTEHVYNAYVTVASDGNAVVAWTSDSGARAQKVDANGNVLWAANGVLLTQPTGNKFVADIEPTLNGDVIVSWSNQTGSGNTLRAQRLASADGASQWGGGTAIQVFNQGSLTQGYFPKFIADGSGGAVFYDYDVTGVSTFNVRVQHLDANGNKLLDPNGVLGTTDTVNHHTGTAAAYDAATGNIYLVWRDNVQIGPSLFDGVSAQRIDASGNRAWGETGKVLVALADSTDSTNAISQLTAVPAAGDAILSWVTGAIPAANQPITATRVDAAGNAVWASSTAFVSTTGYTSRASAVLGTQGFAAYVLENGDEGADNTTIRAQNLNFDGSLGVVSSVPRNDAWSGRIAIPSVASGTPFTTVEANAALSTSDATDPTSICSPGSTGTRGTGTNSLWYSYTTGSTPEYVNLNTQGSYYYTGVNAITNQVQMTPTVVSVFKGQPGAFDLVAGGCNQVFNGFSSYSLIAGLRLEANTTYSIEVVALGTLSMTDPPPPPATSMPTLHFGMSAAPVYTVDRTDDPIPAATACTAGNCSIRAAVNAVNAAPGAIVIPAGTYTMTTTSTNEDANANGDFDVATSASIYGAGRGVTIIDAPVNDRVFDFINPAQGPSGSGQTNLVSDLSLIGPGNPANGGTGTYTLGGALARSRSTSTANATTFQRVELANGYSTNLGEAGSFQTGGALQLAAHGQIIDSDIHDNTGRSGGGVAIMTGAAPFEVIRTTIRNNLAMNPNAGTSSATNGGGGVLAATGATIVDSTIANNQSFGDGGGIAYGNTGSAALAKAEIRSSTIAGNHADSDGDAVGSGGGLRVARNAGVNVYNSIFSGNTTGTAASIDDCTGTTPAAASPSLTGFNLVGAFTGGACAFSAANNDHIGVDPLLGALADNGGPTLTMALGAGSPALDAGDPAGCKNTLNRVLSTDQRGMARVAGLRCDVGAFELASLLVPAPDMPVLDPDSDSGVSNSDDLTNVVNPIVEGTCEASPDYTIDVIVDGTPGGSASCSGAPYQSTVGPLLDGTHDVAVYAVDQNGAPTALSPSLAITIDTQTNATIVSGPNDPSTSPNAMFEIDAEAGDTLMCTLDAGAPVACTSPVSYTNLGGGAHTFLVDASDAAGNHVQQTWNWTITAPAAPSTPVLDPASDSGASNSDGITNATAPVFHGTCEQDGDMVQLLDGATPIGSAVACASGAFTATATSIAEGSHAISAIANRGGVNSTQSGATTVVIDFTAPNAPVVTSPTPPATPPFTMTGTAEANAAIIVAQSGTPVCTASADTNGNWSCAITATGNPLVLAITATDVAGNVSTATTWTDNIAPNAPGMPALDPGSDSGASNSDGITNATAPVFHGTCEQNGDMIQLLDGATPVGTAAACASGAYTATATNIAEGTHAISARATRNGVDGAASAATTVVIDRTAPAIPVVTGPTPPVPPSFTLTGTAEAASAIAVSDNGSAVCNTTTDGTGQWSCAVTTNDIGTLSLSITAADVAGNVSGAAIWNAGIDEIFRNGFDN
ncbi:MAG TPA: Ig-like domain-containing protein [Rhodanobacteraceae bacterium]|nr:Ig-like domain-containing protein [Rhodanobacteraceae bacterium]